MSTLLYSTNGYVQELPQGTKFLFWDKQMDLGRAWKIAKIEMHYAIGKDQAPLYEIYVDMLIQNIFQDPCKSFVSRPDWQAVNWDQWGRMCKWAFGFLPNDPLAFDALISDIRSGNCGRWLGQFFLATSKGLKAKAESCYTSEKAVDAIIFWDFHEFIQWNPNNPNESCKSKRILPGSAIGQLTQEQADQLYQYISLLRAKNGLGQMSYTKFLEVVRELPRMTSEEFTQLMAEIAQVDVDAIAMNQPKRAMQLEVASTPMHDPALVDESGEMVPQGTKKTNWGTYGIIAAALLGAYVLVRK